MTDAVAVGIDLGVSGAVCVIEPNRQPTLTPLPLLPDRTLDAVALRRLVDYSTSRALIVFESVFRPNSLVQLMGEVAAVCKLAETPYLEVPVVRWKKAIYGCNSSDKQVSIDWCQKNYPNLSLLRTPRSRTPSHDFAEAVGLARYSLGVQRGDYL